MAAGVASRRRRALNTIIAAIVAMLCATILDQRTLFGRPFPGPLALLDPIISDLVVYHLFTPPPPTGNVVVAAVDDQSIAELGHFPWPRSVEARLVDALAASGAKVIAFDLLFTERDPADVQGERVAAGLRAAGLKPAAIAAILGPPNDDQFAAAMRRAGNVVLAYPFSRHTGGLVPNVTPEATAAAVAPPMEYNLVIQSRGAAHETTQATTYLPPIPALRAAARQIAYVDIDEDQDSARSMLATIRWRGRYCAPLYLAVARVYRDNPQLALQFDQSGIPTVTLGRETIPVDEFGRMMVHFRGPSRTIPRYSVADIIAGRVPARLLKDKAVIVGMTAHGLGDRLATPVGNDFPGVELQATAVDNVIGGAFIHQSMNEQGEARWAGWLLGLTIAIAAAFLTAMQSLVVLLALGFGYIAYSLWRFASSGALVGLLFPLFALALNYVVTISYRYATEGKEKRRLRSAFEMYLHPQVLASVMDNPAGLKLGGERRHLTVLFSDIVGFTELAERLAPEPLVAMLNTYMSVMTDVILQSGGVVDKLMGDGIMAFWGPPLKMENPARAAIDCALAMLAQLKDLGARDQRFAHLRIGIGIAAGDAIVGNLGGEHHFDYSAVGDTVNLASRLEGLTRQFKVGIIVNQDALQEAGAHYLAREIGLVRVKGREQAVMITEVVAADRDPLDGAYYRRFSQVIELLRTGAGAVRDLVALAAERPDDRVAAMWLDRLQGAGADNPAGIVFEFETK